MSRRARPTLRVLREELTSDWENPYVLRAVERGDIETAQPLNRLGHPILRKAAASFGDDPSQDTYVMPISAVSSAVFLEVKSGPWRAGVWVSDDACWVVVAGRAKGDHDDHDDFYRRLERLEESGGVLGLLPNHHDRALWKKERADALLRAWQLENQARLIDGLAKVVHGGTDRVTFSSPFPTAPDGEAFATVELEVGIFREADYTVEDVVITFDVADRWKGTRLRWLLAMQTLAAISPPEQEWDAFGDTYSNLLEIGTLPWRLEALKQLAEHGDLATTESGRSAHYAHQKSLADHTIEGTAVRAICGVYFVPRQDAASVEVCPTCVALRSEIPEN